MAVHPPSVDPWLAGEVRQARELLDAGDAARCLAVLREAERVATAQGYPQVRHEISALAAEASELADAGSRRKAQRIIARDLDRSSRRDRIEATQSFVPTHVEEDLRSPRHPNGRTLAFIWLGVLVLALVVALLLAVFGEDDANVDEPAGIGALAGLVGLVATFVYIAASVLFSQPRRHPSGWIVAAIVLGGMNLGTANALLDVSETVDSILSAAVLALVGVYVAVSLRRRRT